MGSHAGGVEVETPETEPVRTLASLASALQKDASTEVRGQQFNSVFSTVSSISYILSRDGEPAAFWANKCGLLQPLV